MAHFADKTLVLLPGMMCDERLFLPQKQAFEEAYKVIIPSLGDSDNIDGLVLNLLDSIPAQTFDLAGLSMGGIVAMEVMRQAPERVSRLALLDTNHLADTPERQAMRNGQIDKINAGHLRQVIVDEMKPNYLAAQNRGDTDLLKLLTDMAMDLGAEVFINQSIALRDRPDQTETLKAVKVPTLVMHGEEDTLCPPVRHRQMADLVKGAELVSIPGTGHISTLENPTAVNAAFARWLAREE